MDEEGERLDAVDRYDGYPLAETALELGVAGDVDLLELERYVRTHPLDDPRGAVAEVTAGGRVKRDAPSYG